MTTVSPPTPSLTRPVVVEAELDEPLSRWLWLVKWLLAIPHYVILWVLGIAAVLLTAVAGVAILFTGRYPRRIFDFNLGVLRWGWRVAFYSYGAIGTDRYPPFTLADVPDYPARIDVAYPEQLSRGLVLVKWWLLAIPQYLLVAVFVAWPRVPGWMPSLSLVGILVVIAGVVLAVTGRYPREIFDFVMGLNRWVLRVVAYAGLMTDVYPPFRLDTGAREPVADTADG